MEKKNKKRIGMLGHREVSYITFSILSFILPLFRNDGRTVVEEAM